MHPRVRALFDLQRLRTYKRPSPLILVNGLAEQSESWFANRVEWSRNFDVKVPEILVYDGESIQKRIEAGGEITVGYLAERLAAYLDEFVQRPPYHLIGSSLGGQVILTYAVTHPSKVGKLVLLAPSGIHGDENLPMMEGVRRSQYGTLVKSVFHKERFASEELVEAIAAKFQDRVWKKGVLKTLRGTVGHSVRDLLSQIESPTLFLWGSEDKVIADVKGSIRTVTEQMPHARQVVIPKCGHAPQIEKARLVNQLVKRFLRDKWKPTPPSLDPFRFLALKSPMSILKGKTQV